MKNRIPLRIVPFSTRLGVYVYRGEELLGALSKSEIKHALEMPYICSCGFPSAGPGAHEHDK